MNIGWAVAMIQSTIGPGKPCRRRAWPVSIAIALQKPDGGSKMTEPYIYWTDGARVIGPWMPSQADLLADDYDLVQP